jgi:membrane protease YdiL (CAAX protease family)
MTSAEPGHSSGAGHRHHRRPALCRTHRHRDDAMRPTTRRSSGVNPYNSSRTPAARSKGKLTPPLRAASLTGGAVLKVLGIWLILAAALGTATYFALYLLVPGWRGTETVTLLLVVESYVMAPVAAVIVFGGVHRALETVGFHYTGGRDLLAAVALWAGLLCTWVAIYLLQGIVIGDLWQPLISLVSHASDMSRLPAATPLDWTLIVVRALIITGLAEELIFRGLLFGWLRQHQGFTVTVLITSVLFVIVHIYVILAPAVFLYGLAAGWLRERTGSVLPSLILHSLTDTSLLIAAAILIANHVPP